MRSNLEAMHDFFHLIIDVLRNSFLITGLVIIMMLMIEYVNIHSEGRLFSRLRKHRFGQVVLGAGLGIIPGCMGGFAAVSMYSHKLLSFGALIAMMIASSGDEAFLMLATIPKATLVLCAILFVIAILMGWLVDLLSKKKKPKNTCEEGFRLHQEEHGHGNANEKPSIKNMKHASAERIALLLGVVIFIIALVSGLLEHEHEHEAAETLTHVHVFDEYWINLIFAVVSLFAVWFIATASNHVVTEHLWGHVIRKHFLSIFLWTFGALLVIELGLHYLHMDQWIESNKSLVIPLMILLAVLIGIIPESGPHMLFVTMFASGAVPFSVLLASSISQDGHASLPLLAESKLGFIKAKAINVLVAAIFGYLCYFIEHLINNPL